ncbi:MAG TPA: OsmC family protein [Myxococcota bacterium]|nr:OsmC family protein [Myxococcota bacterium]HKK93039.1 OsmC family protein [Longimicrobiales bacterium]
MAAKSTLLRWTGEDLRFDADGYGGPTISMDSAGVTGPSPMDALLMGVAGCMAIDVLMIAGKSRVPIEALEVFAEGDRAESEPKRYTAIRLVYRIAGPSEADEPKIQRAIDLSREKYCSVLHSIRGDIDVDIRFERS